MLGLHAAVIALAFLGSSAEAAGPCLTVRPLLETIARRPADESSVREWATYHQAY